MLKAAQAIGAKAQNLTGYASGVALCLWLALSFLSPASAFGTNFDLPVSPDLVNPTHLPVGTDGSDGAEDDAVLIGPVPRVYFAPALLPRPALCLAGSGRVCAAFSARAPPVDTL